MVFPLDGVRFVRIGEYVQWEPGIALIRRKVSYIPLGLPFSVFPHATLQTLPPHKIMPCIQVSVLLLLLLGNILHRLQLTHTESICSV